jgi:hypothetical protein
MAFKNYQLFLFFGLKYFWPYILNVGPILEISSDRAELEDTYDEWKAVAEENLGNLAQHGYNLRKVEIDVEELLIWCNSQNRAVDGDARTEFTVVQLRESKQERL